MRPLVEPCCLGPTSSGSRCSGLAGAPSRRAIATRAHPRADIGRAIVWLRAIPAELSVRAPRRRGGARVPTTTVSGTGIGGYSGFPVPLVPPLPPEPVKFPRQRLNQRFAVLLLRSTYEVVDYLDFIPMDKFQIKFWKLRQSEYEPYTLQYYPLKINQGELSDPLYFDFISFAQYATISKEIPNAPKVFKERLGAEGEEVVIQRAPEFADNAILPGAVSTLVGDKVYNLLWKGFEDAVFNGPAPCTEQTFDAALDGVRKLMQVFVDNGYCYKVTFSDVQSDGATKGSFKVKVEGPATLWGAAALASRRSSVVNEFTAMTTAGFLRASGFSKSSYDYRYTDTYIEEVWKIAA